MVHGYYRYYQLFTEQALCAQGGLCHCTEITIYCYCSVEVSSNQRYRCTSEFVPEKEFTFLRHHLQMNNTDKTTNLFSID